MKRKTKSIFYAAITFTFMLLMADFVSFSLISHNEILNTECLDFSKHGVHSHSHYFHDEVLYNEEEEQPDKSDILRGSILLSDLYITHSFISKVWQPPKNS